MGLIHCFDLTSKQKCSSSPNATLLEVNLISAQDLMPPGLRGFRIRTYVVAYIDHNQKLRSRIDVSGDGHPTWNDKFIFNIDKDMASKRPHACIVFEIYQARRLWKDKKIGVVHVLVENLITSGSSNDNRNGDSCMAFNVRTPREDMPRAILNIGVVWLDNVFRESPSFLASRAAMDYRSLTGSL